tara:strand:+ start:4 stop:606 length:603 start_codon:yes stop_codon:yes gene_type:complete
MKAGMQNILKAISKITDNADIKSIINSVNSNQITSKEWLIDNISERLEFIVKNPKVCVAAGWYGMLADKMRDFTNDKVVSFDIDPKCAEYGKIMYPEVSFKTADINDFHAGQYDVIICTSCEHISDETLIKFLRTRKEQSLVVLQSNNYFGLDEHINCKNSLKEFTDSLSYAVPSAKINILNSSEKRINNKFDRYMVIGY